MTLLIILVCLGLERYLGVGAMLYRFRWFDAYLRMFNKSRSQTPWMEGYPAVVIIVLPVLILVGLISLILHGKAYGLLSFIFSAIILLYCLGPESIYSHYTKTDAEKNSTDTSLPSESIQNILWRANNSLFAAIFWFAILGPMGAVLYRMVFLLDQTAQPPDSSYHYLHPATSSVLGILDWLPVRVEAFIFALVGNFSKVLGYWWEYVLTGWRENLNILIGCGYLAEGWQQGAQARHDDIKTALSLIDRTLIVFIAAIALFTIGSWLYFL